ncbi:MAG TPA: alanine racemase [Candidatus Paceibacterota bacterium]|jgi:alanine racemase|nr:alanine racemase [Candidatus Paceibacterota bacterium]
MKNLPLSYIEIEKENLIHNIKQLRKFIHTKTKISAVVKANAYGHGDREVVKILNPYVDYFQINSVEELEKIRKVTKKPILLLGYVGKNDLSKAIKLGCILCVFDMRHALLINEVARRLKIKQKVHIAVDSHLGREGLMPKDLDIFLSEIKKMKNIIIDGVYSHFANIEDTADFSHAQRQIDTYKEVIKIFEKHEFKNIKTHISATSGALAYEKNNGFNNIVRIGIGLYGMWPSSYLEDKWKSKINLKSIIRWVTHVAQVKVLPSGHSIGYGLTYITKKPTTIAVIPQGYADGLTRLLSNKGEVLIRGKRAPILGRVAMNMFVVDVSHIDNVLPEDEVVILGKQLNERITAEEIALKMGTINYEVTTHISPLLPRIIV